MNSNLTAERLREVLSYDMVTGEFRWIAKISQGVVVGRRAGGHSKTSGYYRIRIDGELHLGHRLAFLYVLGRWPDGVIDHIDGKQGNNAWVNLRDVDHTTNMQNLKRAMVSNKSTGLLGSFFDKQTGRWISKIKINGKSKHLGQFDSAEAAHEAYLSEKRKVHAGCTI